MLLFVFILLTAMAALFATISFIRESESRIFTAIAAAIIFFAISLGPLNLVMEFEKPTEIASSVTWANETVSGIVIYVVGSDQGSNGSNQEWRMEKRNATDGSLLWQQTSNPTNSTSIASQADAPIAYMYMGLGILMLIRTAQLVFESFQETSKSGRKLNYDASRSA